MSKPNQLQILIVDDCADFRDTAAAAIAQHLGQGAGVRCAYDGVDALLKLDERLADIVVSDTNMPKMNGIELLKAVKTHFPTVKVYMLFEGLNGSQMTDREVRDLGADMVLSKSEITRLLLPKLSADVQGHWLYRSLRSIFE